MTIQEIKAALKSQKECPNVFIPFSSKDVEKLINLLELSVNTLDKYNKNITRLYISEWNDSEAMKELVYTCDEEFSIIKQKVEAE